MEWMILPYRRYAEFSGRSRRKEYWMFFLFTIIVNVVLTFLQGALGLTLGTGEGGMGALAAMGGVGILSLIFGLASIIPSLAVSVRRLHDTNRSGWWVLAPAVPYVLGIVILLGGAFGAARGSTSGAGAVAGLGGIMMIAGLILGIALLVFLCIEGTRGPNRFGPDPKDPAGSADLSEVFG